MQAGTEMPATGSTLIIHIRFGFIKSACDNACMRPLKSLRIVRILSKSAMMVLGFFVILFGSSKMHRFESLSELSVGTDVAHADVVNSSGDSGAPPPGDSAAPGDSAGDSAGGSDSGCSSDGAE